MDRILVTHAGSLARPGELLSFLAAKDRGGALDEDAYAGCLRAKLAALAEGARLASRELWGAGTVL